MSDPETTRALGRWLRYARDDLRSAEVLLGQGGVPRNSGFLAQQSAEKSIKAIFVFLQMDFPFTHDLERLLDMLPKDWEMKEKLPDLTELSDWPWNPVTPATSRRPPKTTPAPPSGKPVKPTRRYSRNSSPAATAPKVFKRPQPESDGRRIVFPRPAREDPVRQSDDHICLGDTRTLFTKRSPRIRDPAQK